MEDDKLQAAVPETDHEEDRDPRAPAQRATPPEPRGLDPRFRRGSLGPIPIAAPLTENASSAAFHAHLVHLLDAQRADAASSDALDPITPHEDLERQPDGVPHLVIGLTALFSVAIAAIVIGVFHSGATLGSGAAVLIAFVGVPMLVFRLGAKADRDRDHDHPSR
ncbi:MAG TPA: hypothetical protein VLM79_23635 [Kofleriaceae bacterium]|nr:hypothetical protein [Kofleriaceae bacterium]